jgi:hypothetical protein
LTADDLAAAAGRLFAEADTAKAGKIAEARLSTMLRQLVSTRPDPSKQPEKGQPAKEAHR